MAKRSEKQQSSDDSDSSASERRRKGRKRDTGDSFVGRAAQFAVISELLKLGCNAAIPEVDLGTDVFAFRDDREEIARIQVKACMKPREYKDLSGYSARFSVPIKQLDRLDDRPRLFYALAISHKGKWVDFLVISREELQSFYNGSEPFGHLNRKSEELEITIEFREQVQCSGRDLTAYRNAWAALPPLQPRPEAVDLRLEKLDVPSAVTNQQPS